LSSHVIAASYLGDPNYTASSATITDTRAVSTSPTGVAVASSGPTTLTATGVGAVTVLQYASNPVGTPDFDPSGVFFDAAVSANSTFSNAVIQDCQLNGGTELLWWNTAADGGLGAWQPVVGDPGPIFTAGPPACLTVTLDNATSPSLSQLTGTVFGLAHPSPQPSIVTQSEADVPLGARFSFTVGATGSPTPTLIEHGLLPTGLTFASIGNGTATISGTATGRKQGNYAVTITATNALGHTTQMFTLSVKKPVKPKFVASTKLVVAVGIPFSATIEATGWPYPSVRESGGLPQGVLFTGVLSRAGVISGLPAAGTEGTYRVQLIASSGVGSPRAKTFVLVVRAAPSSGKKARGDKPK